MEKEVHKSLRSINLDITGYAISCSNERADKAMNTDIIREAFNNIKEFDLANEGEDAVMFLKGRHNFQGDVFVILRNFGDADEDTKEKVSMNVKPYHENHFFNSGTPKSLLLITNTDYPLNRHDGTLSGRVKYID